MRINHLSLKNIGPFIEADIDFAPDVEGKPPVTLITGENGTGKSIILDAIRGVFGATYGRLERDIQRRQRTDDSEIEIDLTAADLEVEPKNQLRLKTKKFDKNEIWSNLVDQTSRFKNPLREIPNQVQSGQSPPNWVVDYWPSMLADETERAKIEARLKEINPEYFGYLEIDNLLNTVAKGDSAG